MKNTKHGNFTSNALRLTTALVAVGMLGLSSATAYALSDLATPQGAHVVGGAATISNPAAGQLNITQTTDRAVIDWNSFNVGKKATVQFLQPSSSSLVVNRVGGHDPAQILGTVKANGNLVILDKNGLFFGPNSVVNANSLIAATGDVDTKHAMHIKTTLRIFDVQSKSTIENDGTISVKDAGLVALVAPTVINEGTIKARYGRVGLAAGEKVAVDLYGDGLISIDAGGDLSHALIRNSGLISAEGGEVKIGTDVAAGVVKNAVNNKGVIDVSSVTVNNGTITLVGDATVGNTGKFVTVAAATTPTAPSTPPTPPTTPASSSGSGSSLTPGETSVTPPTQPATGGSTGSTSSSTPPTQPTTPTTPATPPAQTAGNGTPGVDLKDWYLTLPVDSKGSTGGTAAEVHKGLDSYQSEYFKVGPQGQLTFTADVAGAKTKSTKYARSELRETKANGDLAAWNLKDGGTMTATMSVDKVPTLSDGTLGKEVIGQIHGKSDELVRLYWDNGNVYFHNDRAGSSNKEMQFNLTDAMGNTPKIGLGQKFSYEIHAQGTDLTVSLFTGGKTYSSTTKINSVWQSDSLYFKAGVYLGANASQGAKGVGQTSFYGLDYSHTAGEGLGGLLNLPVTLGLK
jgi:filamentous hemagglutinin family protein